MYSTIDESIANEKKFNENYTIKNFCTERSEDLQPEAYALYT